MTVATEGRVAPKPVDPFLKGQAKVSLDEWAKIAFFSFLAIFTTIFTGGWIYQSGSSWYVIINCAIAGLLYILSAGVFQAAVYQQRKLAVDQCLTLMAILNEQVSQADILCLERKNYAGEIFRHFVDHILPLDKLNVPRRHYFVVTGGERTSEACRKLVRFLYNNINDKDVLKPGTL